MKYFFEMTQFARTNFIVYADHGKDQVLESNDDFFEKVEQCQPFVFTLSGDNIPLGDVCKDDKGNTVFLKMDAPFSVFSIEMLDGFVTISQFTDEVDTRIKCVLAYEIEPKKFAYYIYIMGVNFDGRVYHRIMSTRALDGIVNKFIDRINGESLGTEHIREKIKIGTGNAKRFHTVRKIVHVRPKRQQSNTNITTGRVIDWSHRWLVRGHWRTITGLGKDRAGNYCVTNNTWVSEHAKGNPNLPLVNKTRVIGD